MNASRPGLAAVWMIGSIVSFSSMAIAGRAIADTHNTFEILMYRSFIGIFIVVVVASATGRLGEITTRSLHIQALRNVFHFAGQNLWFWSLTLIPLAQLFALEFTSPIWVTLLAPLILSEKLTRVRLFAAALGFVGVLIVARPGATPITPGVIAAAASAIGFAGSILFTKVLTRTETITCILFWLTVMQAMLGVATVWYVGELFWPTYQTLPWLALIGVAGLVAHLCLTKALLVAPAAIVAPMDFVRLPVIAVIGALYYGESLSAFVLIGAAVIFIANYLNVWFEAKNVTNQIQ